jgi:hypothetical protein
MTGRREFLSLASLAVVGVMGGCTSGNPDTAQSDTETSDPIQTPTGSGPTPDTPDSESSAATSTTGPPDGGSTPVETVRRYYQALNRGEVTAANRFVVSESSPLYVEEQFSATVTIHTIENPSLREVIDRTRDVEERNLDSRVEQARADLREFLDQRGYEDHTFVYVSASTDGNEQEGYIRLVKDDGRWLLVGVGTS